MGREGICPLGPVASGPIVVRNISTPILRLWQMNHFEIHNPTCVNGKFFVKNEFESQLNLVLILFIPSNIAKSRGCCLLWTSVLSLQYGGSYYLNLNCAFSSY